MLTRDTLLTVDFLNKCIFTSLTRSEKIDLTDELLERFINVIDPFWNSDKDKIDYFAFFNTEEYFCQRRKLKYDFSTESTSWSTYNFTGASLEQAKEFYELCKSFFGVAAEVKIATVDAKIQEIEDQNLFFEQRFVKKRKERDALLQASDWRILPDVPDKFPGEKDMWIQWRSYLRDYTVKRPSEFETNLDFFRYSYDILFPIDPEKYRRMYPNGLLEDGVTPAPDYMDTDDSKQWVKYDAEASNDFVRSRMQGIYNLNAQYKKSYRKVSSAVLELMKMMQVDDLTQVDWSKYYTELDTDLNIE